MMVGFLRIEGLQDLNTQLDTVNPHVLVINVTGFQCFCHNSSMPQ